MRRVADPCREKPLRVVACMDDAENDTLALLTFPRAHRSQIWITNLLERLNVDIGRRTNLAGTHSTTQPSPRLVGAMRFEQNDG